MAESKSENGELSIEVIGNLHKSLGVSESFGLVLFSNVCESYQADLDVTCDCIILDNNLQLKPEDKICLYEIGSKNIKDPVVCQNISDVNEDGPNDYTFIRQFKVTFNACNLPKISSDTYYQFRYVSSGNELGVSTFLH